MLADFLGFVVAWIGGGVRVIKGIGGEGEGGSLSGLLVGGRRGGCRSSGAGVDSFVERWREEWGGEDSRCGYGEVHLSRRRRRRRWGGLGRLVLSGA